MGLVDQLGEDIKSAMKRGEKERLSVLRMLSAQLKNKRIELRAALTDNDAIAVFASEQKKRRDAAEQYKKAGATDRAQAETAEAELIGEYLPKALTDAELEAAVDAAIEATGATTKKEMGLVMKEVLGRYAGRVDGKTVQQLVTSRLD